MLAVGIEPTYTEVRRIYSPLSHHCGLASQIDFGEKGFSPFRSATILSPQRIKHFLKFWAGLSYLPLSPLGDYACTRYPYHPVLIMTFAAFTVHSRLLPLNVEIWERLVVQVEGLISP